MCGRYVLDGNLDQIAKRFEAKTDHVAGSWDWEPRYNICPTQVVPAITRDGDGDRQIVPMRWGLHPHWSKDAPGEGRYGPLFNARSETAAKKPSFRTPWKRRRALIPFTHWYEWTGEQGGKVPWCIRVEDEPMTAFAGLWDCWRVDEGVELLSCAILTTDSNGPLEQLHHRMPVRLPEEYWDDWLDVGDGGESKGADPDMLLETQLDGEDLVFWEVGRSVGNSRSRGAELIQPVA